MTIYDQFFEDNEQSAYKYQIPHRIESVWLKEIIAEEIVRELRFGTMKRNEAERRYGKTVSAYKIAKLIKIFN